MAGTAFLNIPLIRTLIDDAAEATLDEIGERIAIDARHRAPVRKVFREKKGYKRKYRALTAAETALATQRANRYYGLSGSDLMGRKSPLHQLRAYSGRVQIRRPSSANTPANSRALRFLGYEHRGLFTSTTGATRSGRGGGYEPGEAGAKMTARGRAETRSGAAIHTEESGTGHGTRVQVGGALKASIESDGVTQTATGQSVTVAARIRYAKFVEFPTVRTAAQPFLLPAMQGQREKLVSLFAANLRKAFGGR